VGLVVYGDGPLRPWIERAARRTPGVHLAGFTRDRAELARAIASADGLLHGSAAETFGLSVAEALWAGCPVVVPDRGGAAQLYRPELGETYTPGDAHGCAAAITRLLGRDRHELGLAARAHAAARVPDLDTHFARLFALYSAL
jgi:alpha-1,6-mannosyltransferase